MLAKGKVLQKSAREQQKEIGIWLNLGSMAVGRTFLSVVPNQKRNVMKFS